MKQIIRRIAFRVWRWAGGVCHDPAPYPVKIVLYDEPSRTLDGDLIKLQPYISVPYQNPYPRVEFVTDTIPWPEPFLLKRYKVSFVLYEPEEE